MKFFKYIVLSLLLLTVFNVSSQEQYIKILDFRVDETTDVATIHTLAQDFAYVSPNSGRCWALLIIESNVKGENIKISTGASNNYVEKLKCDAEHWYEKGIWRQPSQEEKNKLRAKMDKVKMPNEKWVSIDPGVLTRVKVTTLGESPKGLNPKGEAVIKNSKGEIIGLIESGMFIANSSIARKFEEGKVYRLTIEVPQDYPIIAPIAPENPVETNSSNSLTPKWAPEVTIEQGRIITELIESMVLVEGGTFYMGAQKTDPNVQNYNPDAESNESPVHQVILNDYHIGKYEVTQEQWQIVMGKNPSKYKGNNNPVECVSWDDCQEFIQKLNQMTGLNFALPTEAQWEYAARGGHKSKGYNYSGSNNLDSVGWYWDNASKITHPVGQKCPNELGLYDMSGNVFELCHDLYNNYNSTPQTDPAGPTTGYYRVLRGGDWFHYTKPCRVSFRDGIIPSYRDLYYGLRLVINKPELKHNETATIPALLIPKWIPEVTKKQKRIIGELIKSMVMVEGGTFTMGATSEQGSDAASYEKPTHHVTLSDYYIGKYEVTQEQWQAVMGNNLSKFKGNRKPVESVSWNDCQEFIKELNRLTGLNFAFPTEAQWEYAARGGNKSRGYKYSGSNKINDVAYYNKDSGGAKKVGQKQPNELGLYDMSGNVWEWCQDWYGDYSNRAQTNPTGLITGSNHIIRGGSWNLGAINCRVSSRGDFAPDFSSSILGFRLAVNPK